jgi:arginine repressor
MASTESKADDGFRVYVNPDTSKTDPITTVTTDTATIVTRTNIGGSGGTGTIIGTITIETMIGTTTEIDALLILFSDNKFRW